MASTQLLTDTLALIKRLWPDITIAPDRIAGWEKELTDGTGRTPEQLKSDILTHVVGKDRLAEYVTESFTSRGMDVAAGGETAEERAARIADEFIAGRRFDEFETTLDELTPAPVDSDPSTPAVGSTDTVPGIMAGGKFTRITRAGQDDLYAMVYVVNGIEHVYTFDSYEAAERILGQNPITQGKYGFQEMDESALNDGNTWVLGDAAAFSGQDGTYQLYFDDIMQEAALEAGVRNPGKVGEFLSQPEIQRIMAEGEAGGWSEERIQAEIRNTGYYQNTMYPGIVSFMNAGVADPEGEWRRYARDVDSSLEMLGYERDADGTFGSAVGEMLTAGITAENFTSFAPTFVRAEQSQDFAAALNRWTENDLGKTLDFEDWFDVLEGSSSTELNEVVEKATIQFAAERTNTQLDANTIARLAELTNLSEAQMSIAFSNAEQALLAVGSNNLERYGLSEQALVNSAFGIEGEVPDPLSSDGGVLTATEVQRRARKAATELGLQDDKKAQFFVGFSQQGTPQRGGLASLAQEGG